MSILHFSLINHIPTHSLSPSRSICGPTHLFLTHKFSLLTLTTPWKPVKSTIIRMGRGPRTFPGGISKWQWKRMQAKKSKQLLKARLARKRQIFEMRKRAELKATVSELERPWKVIEKAPSLFSARADEQLKVLADRFQKPGGLDLWSEKDGPGGISDNGRTRRNDGNLDEYGELNSVNGYGTMNRGRNLSRRIWDGLSNSDDELGEVDLEREEMIGKW